MNTLTTKTPALPALEDFAAAQPAPTTEPSLDGQSDTRQPIRLGLWVLVGGFALFTLWAALAPLDEGVIAVSRVSSETNRLAIQHLQGGVIRSVAVIEGQQVKAGDLLVELDEASTRANFESIRQNYLAQRAAESRLMAEMEGATALQFHEDLRNSDDTVAAQLMAVQKQLFAARRAALAAERAAIGEQIAGYRGQIVGLQQVLDNRRARRDLLSTQIEGVRALAADGYAPRNQLLQLEEQATELRGSIADADSQIQRSRNAIAELQARLAQRVQETLTEVSRELSEVRREVQANQEKLVAIRAELGRTRITAPVDGQVVGLAIAGAGGVVGSAQRLMDIVPQQARLVLDAQVPPHVIDRVRAGDPTEVRFSGFSDSPTLMAEGRVLSISSDSVTQEVGATTNTFYLARVELTEAGQRALGQRTMQPGMPAEVLINTGERSLLTYLLHPLTKRIAAAMKEE